MLYTTSPAKVPARPIPIWSWPYCSTEGILPAPLLRLCLGPAPIRDSHDAANTHQWGLTVDTLTRTMRRRGETSKQWQGSATGRLGFCSLDMMDALPPGHVRGATFCCAAPPLLRVAPFPFFLRSPFSLPPSVPPFSGEAVRVAGVRGGGVTMERNGKKKKTMLDPACRYGSGYTRRMYAPAPAPPLTDLLWTFLAPPLAVQKKSTAATGSRSNRLCLWHH